MAELLVREDDMFRNLMQSLARARMRSGPGAEKKPLGLSPKGPASPKEGAGLWRPPGLSWISHSQFEARSPEKHEDPSQKEPSVVAASPADYFSDELRGYRLLKSAGINHSERQQVLTLTGNRVNFEEVRQALRGLFDSGAEPHPRHQSSSHWVGRDRWRRRFLPGPARRGLRQEPGLRGRGCLLGHRWRMGRSGNTG